MQKKKEMKFLLSASIDKQPVILSTARCDSGKGSAYVDDLRELIKPFKQNWPNSTAVKKTDNSFFFIKREREIKKKKTEQRKRAPLPTI